MPPEDETTEEEAPQSETFSVQGAHEAAELMFKALTKKKQHQFLGHWNEIAVTINMLVRRVETAEGTKLDVWKEVR